MMTAYLYAGQGAQKAGMGRDLYEHSEVFRRAFESANLDFDLKETCFEDPEGKLSRTQYTQPCLMAMEAGITAMLEDAGLSPDFTAGLSLGEYAALEAAHVLTAKEAIEMTAFRGKAMARASEGIDCGMTAILGLSEEALKTCCREASGKGVVSISNYNCPGQLVIGGEKAAVDQAAAYAREAGAKRCLPLNVSGPFHTKLMEPAARELSAYCHQVDFKPASAIVMFNCLGRENSAGLPVSDLLVRQVMSSVYMEQILRRLLAAGVTEFVEIGPGKTLTGFVRRVAASAGVEFYTTWNLNSYDNVMAYLDSLKEMRKKQDLA